jgi:hypothetical protein
MNRIAFVAVLAALVAAAASAQVDHNHIGLFLGGSAFPSSSGIRGTSYMPMKLDNFAPSGEIRFGPLSRVSAGVEYSRLQASGSRTLGIGTPMTAAESERAVHNLILGNVFVTLLGKGKSAQLFAYGGGGLNVVRSHWAETLTANAPRFKESEGTFRLSKKESQRGIDAGGGIRFVKGHFGFELAAGVLRTFGGDIPQSFGLEVKPRLGLFF